jgi:acetylornithine deacetylase/succinyl-diaminopimelate desuccinylase-like protein
MQVSLQKVFEVIEQSRGEHVERIKELIRIPSIAAENPVGVRQCATYLAGIFRDLGCQEVKVYETRGQPVVYAHYDADARNTLLVYMMYDVKQVSGEKWSLIKDPFDPQVVGMPPFKSVLVGRGSINSKGPLMAFVNALVSVKRAGLEIPLNLKFVAEGEEELGSTHLREFVKENISLFDDCQAVFSPSASQGLDGQVTLSLGCKGVVEFELECSGKEWGRGPAERAVHSSRAAFVESPVWRMIHALSSMTDPHDPDHVMIEGFYDNVAPPDARDLEFIEELTKDFDEESLHKELGVRSFYRDLKGKELLVKMFYTTTLNIQGIEAGYTGPLFKTILPDRAVAKLESRLIPNQTITETVEKVRRHLDRLGYTDVRIHEYPEANSVDDWSRTNPDSEIVKHVIACYKDNGLKPRVFPFSLGSSPQAVFTKDPLKLPFVSAGVGHGSRAHAPDEYYVIEGNESVRGLAEAEKFFTSLIFRFSEGDLGKQ